MWAREYLQHDKEIVESQKHKYFATTCIVAYQIEGSSEIESIASFLRSTRMNFVQDSMD